MSKTESSNLESLPLEEFHQRIDRVRALLGEVDSSFPGMVTLTAEERLRSDGKLKVDESAMLNAVLDAVDGSPQYFASLATDGVGNDPHRFETRFLRDQLARRDLLSQVAADLAALSGRVNDTVMQLGSRVRPRILAAYRIGKSISTSDARLRGKLARVIDFYARSAKRRPRVDHKSAS
jgi:hypothetical protein